MNTIFQMPLKPPQCHHNTIELDMEEKVVVCKLCGRKIEPIDYLLECAYREGHAIERLNNLEKEVEAIAFKVKQLKHHSVIIRYLYELTARINKAKEGAEQKTDKAAPPGTERGG